MFLRYVLFCFLLLLTTLSNAAKIDPKTYIPPQAKQYFPIIEKELDTYFPDIPYYAYVPSLIEHESCISLTHKKCWNPSSKLETERELGIGFGQTTKAYKKDGSIRFDKLQEMKDKYNRELKELSWNNITNKPELQIRILILISKDNYKKLFTVKDPYNRLIMSDVAYNGGYGAINKDRTICGLKEGCNPQLWFNNVELTCSSSKKIIYDVRTACDIQRHHAEDVFKIKLPKYKPYFI